MFIEFLKYMTSFSQQMYLLGAYYVKSRKGGTIHSFEIIVHKTVLLPALLGVKYTKIKCIHLHLSRIIFNQRLHFLPISRLYCMWLFRFILYKNKRYQQNGFMYIFFENIILPITVFVEQCMVVVDAFRFLPNGIGISTKPKKVTESICIHRAGTRLNDTPD